MLIADLFAELYRQSWVWLVKGFLFSGLNFSSIYVDMDFREQIN